MKIFKMLRHELKAAGCFKLPRFPFLQEMLMVLVAYISGYLILLLEPSLMDRILVLAIIAFVSVQAGFVAHEASHGGISSNAMINAVIGQCFLSLINGISYTWFLLGHRRHHTEPEDPSTPRKYGGTLKAFQSIAKRLPGPMRVALIWILSILRGAGLKLDSLYFVLVERKATGAEVLLLISHFAIWIAVPLVVLGFTTAVLNYLILTLFIGVYIGPVLLLSHTGHAPLSPQATHSHLLHQLGTTRNIHESVIGELALKGIGEHVEHHLFPAIPQSKLRRARRITQAFCLRHGLTYNTMSFSEAVLEISKQAARFSIGTAGGTSNVHLFYSDQS